MANDFYTHGSYPATRAPGSSAAMRAQLDLITAGFDKLPALTAVGDRIVHINAGSTVLTTTSGFTFDGTTFTAPALAVTGASVLTGDLAVNGGDLTSSAATFNLLATPTTLNIGAAATTIALGAATGALTLGPALIGSITTDATTPTTGAWKTAGGLGVAKALWVGGLLNVATTSQLTGNVTLGGTLVGPASATVFNTVSTTVNAFGAATTLNVGAATGTLTVANTTLAAKAGTFSTTLDVTGNTTLTGDLAVNGGDLTTTASTFNLINTTATTLNIGSGATTALRLGTTGATFGFGSAGSSTQHFRFAGDFTAANTGVTAIGTVLTGSLTAGSGQTTYQAFLAVLPTGMITNGAGETIALITSARFDEPIITLTGADLVTTAVTLYINGAATEATNNYAFFVDAGTVRLDGALLQVGNVRIGSLTSPTVALDVTGAALISTTLGVTGHTTLSSLSLGGVLITQATSAGGGVTLTSQLHGVANTAGLGLNRFTADTGGANLTISKSRGTTVGDYAVVVNGDILGGLNFAAADGTDMLTMPVRITATVDGVPGGASQVPGALRFYTSTGAADNLTQRLVIDSAGLSAFTGSVTVSATLGVTGATTHTGTVYIGDTSNANQTLGLTINGGANDNQHLAIKNTDVSHGLTTITLGQDVEDDDFFVISKYSATLGGAYIYSLAESTATESLMLETWGGAPATTDTTASLGAMNYFSGLHNNANADADMAANSNLAVWGEIDSNNARLTRMLLKADDGELHLGNTTLVALDGEDDVSLVRSMQYMASKGNGMVVEPWENEFGTPAWNYETLRRVGVLGERDKDGNCLFRVQPRFAMNEGAIWQTHKRVRALEGDVHSLKLAHKQIKTLTRKLARLESRA